MYSNKSSTLPAVLKEYLPEYEPRPSQSRPSVTSTLLTENSPGVTQEVDNARGNEAALSQIATAPSPLTGHAAKKGRSSGARETPPSRRRNNRERSFVQMKQQEAVKYHQNYNDWQNIKQEFREEKREKFLHKLSIQREIIRKRDELYQLRAQSQADDNAKRLAEKRLAQHEQNEALQAVCRQSLDEDRQKLADRAAKRAGQKEAKTESSTEDTSKLQSLMKPLGERQLTYISERSTHSSLASVPIHAPPTPPVLGGASAKMEEYDEFAISEEDEDDKQEDTEAGEDGDALPWHHAQLYHMYGKQADYFLHPKIEQEKKTFDKPMNPKLRKQGAREKKGRAGAGVLWNTLRNDSRMKLLGEDASIPSELKAAYSAFVRQLLTRRRRPVKRNYYCEEDVPEMDRLLDQSRLHHAHDYKHKVELMYRSSLNNEDRTGVLVYNDPLPDLNNWQGGESVARYMPSWADGQDDQSSIASYKKWIDDKEQQQLTLPTVPEQVSNDQQAQDDWSFLRQIHPKKDRPKEKSTLGKIHFLTEKESTVPGEFSRRRKEKLEAMHMPKGFTGGDGPGQFKSQSAMALIGPDGDGPAHSGGRGLRGQSTSPSLDWQPLSLNALAEYKKEKDTAGCGHFQQGAAPVWPAQTVS